ncbi:Flp pilus assembly complex ATPase component TadA [Patescibacteria group bacterium]|nr:Flp pilus assembly complex ATPase component TadA [Patescibacteria group bacterium]
MATEVIKKILEQEDVKALKPNFTFVKYLPKDISEKAQTIVFDGEKTRLKLLTTNVNTLAVKSITDQLAVKGYKTELYYTDEDSFRTALARYDSINEQEAKDAEEQAATQNALGQSAEELLQKLYAEKANYDDGNFLHEIIRLTFQAGASDLHFQPEQDVMRMRLRKDGIMKNVLEFTEAEFKKYSLKLKFMSGAKMNIDYLPQDGRFDFPVDINGKKKQIDVRVSFMPGLR